MDERELRPESVVPLTTGAENTELPQWVQRIMDTNCNCWVCSDVRRFLVAYHRTHRFLCADSARYAEWHRDTDMDA